MKYNIAVLLACLGANMACTSSSDETPETPTGTQSDNLSQNAVVEDGTNQNAPAISNRRLKSFRVEYQGGLLDTFGPPAVVSGQLLPDLIPTEIAYEDGKVQQLLHANVDLPGSAPFLLASYFYDQGALKKIVWESMKERKVEYDIVDGKTIAENWVDENGIERRKSYEYDADGNLVRVVGGFLDFLGNCQSGYNDDDYLPVGNLTLTYENSQVVSIVSDAGDVSVDYEYNADNLLISRTSAYGCAGGTIVETFTYNDNGQLATFELINEFESAGPSQAPNAFRTYQYNDKGQIMSISRSGQQGGSGNVSVMSFKYDSNDDLVEIIGEGNVLMPAPVYSFTYEDGACEQQTYTDPEFAASPTHTALYVNIFPESLRCGYFLPVLQLH